MARRTLEQALQATSDATWRLEEVGYDPLRETSRQSRFALSNGFLGVRGERAFNRGERWVAPSRTYVAGLFDTPTGEAGVPALALAPDWLQVRVILPGGPLVHQPGEAPSHRMTLDMKRGLLLTDCKHGNEALGVRVQELRLVSLHDRAVGLQLVRLEIEEGQVDVTLEASFEGTEASLALEMSDEAGGVWRTRRSGLRLAMASAVSLTVDGETLRPTRGGEFRWSWSWTASPGQVVILERTVAVQRGGDPGVDVAPDAERRLDRAVASGWREVVSAHEAAWADRWARSDVEIVGDSDAQRALRFAAYHLNGAANPDDERVSIGARALTGDDYDGHVFWDTEIFLLPFYCLTWPEAARALLMYRFHTLEAARAKAVRLGWRGALYAWESAGSGDEATPAQGVAPDRQVIDILCGTQEQHISADVAYAVWQYWLATADEGFMREAGAEILLETARFWASRAVLETDGRRHIRGVIGPDEYHETIDDNAFTNNMARWNIGRGLETADWLRDHWPERWSALSRALGLDAREMDDWRDAERRLVSGLDPETGLYEQFEGYDGMEAIDLAAYGGRSVPMDIVLGRERTQGSQVIKQADVVALLALLPDTFSGASAAANFDVYAPRCGHGSSLSTALHGLVAARLGRAEAALDYFERTAAIDLTDTRVAIAGGVHIAALGGVWMMTIQGFAGVSLRTDGVAFRPRLPTGWTALRFALQWQGRTLAIEIDGAGRRFRARLRSGAPMTIFVEGEAHDLKPDQAVEVSLRAEVPAVA